MSEVVPEGISAIMEEAHRMHNAWLALQGLAGTEIALEILGFMKPLPPPSREFTEMVKNWAAKMALPGSNAALRREVAAVRDEMRTDAESRNNFWYPNTKEWCDRLTRALSGTPQE